MDDTTWWRLVGELAMVRDTPVPDNLRSFIVDRYQMGPHVVILDDPALPHGDNWLTVSTTRAGERFLQSNVHFMQSRFYAVAEPGDGVRGHQPRYAGYWRSTIDDSGDLPWPTPVDWPESARFLDQLDRVEQLARRNTYRGRSSCRLCGQINGRDGLRLERWEWPEGFRHYIVDHGVRPTAEFEAFVATVSSSDRARRRSAPSSA
jgi:hypothetical protein